MRLQGWEWIIILAIVLLLWGAPKLPGLAKSVAQSLRIFKKEIGSEGQSKTSEAKPQAETTPEGEQKQG
jgi:sec-independent protein translocase protein TatA